MVVPIYFNRLFCSETKKKENIQKYKIDEIAVGILQVFKCDKV